MYDSYFGLTEHPFSIAPDPRYLYLSEGHREALAHLLYGIGEGGGFVQLTGEVGTGKTTVCRALLEQLPPEVDVAMVFNPALTAPELLATVCEELRIACPKDSTSFKVLVDALYRYLLEAHARGRRTVIIIDEAQNLGREVLEQIRLLTNLETTREKLLQIILIGQPELRQLLTRPDLRQLAQRVTARYHLRPFTERETRAYVHHRLRVAGQRRQIFDQRAMGAVHRYSRGIPRLINTICDRALLGAYATGRPEVTAGVVRRAAAEVLGQPGRARRWVPFAVAAAALLALAGAGTLLGTARLGRLLPSRAPAVTSPAPATAQAAPAPSAPAPTATAPTAPAPSPVRAPAPPVTAAAPPARVPAAPARVPTAPATAPAAPATAPAAPTASRGPAPESPRPGLTALLAEPPTVNDRATAFTALFARWHLEYQGKPGELACDHARQVGLRCTFRTGSWSAVRRLDLPAILTLATGGGGKRNAVLTALDEEKATLELGGKTLTLLLREIESAWDGAFIALWKPPAMAASVLSPGMRDRGVPWVRQRIAEADGRPGPARNSDLYDEELKRQVVAFQRAQQIVPDGIVGDETLMRLVAVARDPGAPSLAPGPR